MAIFAVSKRQTRRIGFTLGLCLPLFWLSVAHADPAQVDQLVQRWLALAQQTTTLEQTWQQEQPLLNQRQTLLKAEINQLQAVLAHSEQGQDEVAQKREELLQEQNSLEQKQQQILDQLITQLETQLRALQPQLPPPVANSWAEEAKQLDANAEPSQRLQVALAQLGQLLEFDQRVSVHEMPLSDNNGQTIVVKQLYLGASSAWFVSPDGRLAGTGSVVDHQWQWQFKTDVDTSSIQTAIASFNKTRDPQLVALPVHLKQPAVQ